MCGEFRAVIVARACKWRAERKGVSPYDSNNIYWQAILTRRSASTTRESFLSELIGLHDFHPEGKGPLRYPFGPAGCGAGLPDPHDRIFGRVRREHLVETGKRIRLKHDVALFAKTLENLSDGYKISFNVISAAPQEIIQSALEGIVPPENFMARVFSGMKAAGK